MICYVFPLNKDLSSGVFNAAVIEINHKPFLTHVGDEQVVLTGGLKPDSTVYLNGSTEEDPYNVYLWYETEKTSGELTEITNKIIEVIDTTEPEF